MKKAVIVAVVVVLCVACAGISIAAEKEGAKQAPVSEAPMAAAGKAMPAKAMPRANFSMLYGTITKIDTSDPANVKLEVKNEADNTAHTVELTPATNVTKVTDVSELKAGENVRVMARKVDGKEVAMGVMFGKIRKPAPRPVRPAATMAPPQAAVPTQQPSAKQQPKK
jgi:hypothetical protein